MEWYLLLFIKNTMIQKISRGAEFFLKMEYEKSIEQYHK